MTRPSRRSPLCLTAIWAGLLASCDQGAREDVRHARKDLSDKQAEIEVLKVTTHKLQEALVEAERKALRTSATDKDGEKMQKAVLDDLQDMKEKNSALKKELESLRKENERLQREATSKVRMRAIGEETAELAARNGKTYRKVRIRSVDDYGVSITHETGSATLRRDSAPESWIQRFALLEEPVFGPDKPLASVDAMMTREDLSAPSGASSAKKLKPGEVDAMVRAKFDGIMLVDGKDRAASAFLAESAGVTYLYTAAHVLSSEKKLSVRNSSGVSFTKFGTCEIATDCDLARIKVEAKPGLALQISPRGGAGVGKEIRAVGNSAGSGVLTVLEGKITGLGVTEFEISATVIEGNSGGPVISAETGEVLGVVCRGEAGRQNVWSSGTEFAEVRRFASRIDRAIEWRKVSLESLQGEKDRLATFDSRTKLALALAALQPDADGLRLHGRVGEGEGQSILSILLQHQHLAPIQKLIAMNRELGNRRIGTSQKDLQKRFAAYYKELVGLFVADTAKFDPEAFSFPNRKEAEQSHEWRKEATQLLQTSAQAFGAR